MAVSGILFQEFDPRYNTTILSLGYSKSLKNLDALRFKISFDKYFLAPVDSLEESSFNSSLNLGTSYRLNKFRTSANLSLLLGSDPSTLFNWDFMGQFDLWKLSPLKKLRFEPRLSFFFGNETVLLTSIIEAPGRFSPNNFVQSTATLDEKYGLLNTQIRLPVSLTYNNFDFEIGYNYNIPRSLGGKNLGNTSFVNISVGEGQFINVNATNEILEYNRSALSS